MSVRIGRVSVINEASGKRVKNRKLIHCIEILGCKSSISGVFALRSGDGITRPNSQLDFEGNSCSAESMKRERGHERKSAVHSRALAAGARMKRHQNLDAETTLIEYDNAGGCYLYFASVPGSYHVSLQFDEVVKLWPDENIPLPIQRVPRVVLS